MTIELPKPIAVTPVPNVRYREFTKCGQKPLAGGQIWTYEANSTTPKITYQDPYGFSPNTNPIILDAAGEADVYLNGTYRFVVKDRHGVVQKDVGKIGSWFSGDLDDQFKSLNDALESSAQQLMQPLQEAINIAAAAGAGAEGWTAMLVADESGQNQQGINNIQLSGIESISALRVTTPFYKGHKVSLISALKDQNKGGGDFVATRKNGLTDNGGTIIASPRPGFFWVRIQYVNVSPEMFCAPANGIDGDSDAFTRVVVYAKEARTEIDLISPNYFIDKTVDILMGKSYKDAGTIMRGLGKAKTYIKVKSGVDGFNLTNIDQRDFATNVTLEEFSLVQENHDTSSVAIKTDSNITNINMHNISFFEFKRPVGFDRQFYIARITGLHSQGGLHGFKFGLEGTTLNIDNCFVTGGGDRNSLLAEPPTAFEINASYSVIGALACDDFAGIPYHFGWGQYSIGSLGIERLHTRSSIHIHFDHCNANVGNIELVGVDNLLAKNKIIYANDSSVDINSINTSNSKPASQAKLLDSFVSTVSIKKITGTTTYAKPSYDPSIQSAEFGVEFNGVRYQRGDQRPFIGLGNSTIPDQLTSYENPCKQSIIFDIYGANFFASGYNGEQNWQWYAGPKQADWGIQRRPDIFGIAANVLLKESKIINDSKPHDVAHIPLVSFEKPTNPASGAIYIDLKTGVMQIYIVDIWKTVTLT